MAEELKQAAQQALEALEHAEKDVADFQRLNTDQTSVAIKALRQALTAAQPAQAGEVQQRLFQLLNGAAGDGLIINDIDAAELFTDLFPEHIEFITRGGVGPTQPAAQAEAHPLASRCYTMSESHLSGHRLILGFETMEAAQAAHTWVANLGKPAAQATPEPDTCRKRPRCGRADPCAWLEKQATQQAAREPVGEVVYQYQIANGSWIDQTKESHDYNVKRGQATVRVLYTHPAPGVPDGFVLVSTGLSWDECLLISETPDVDQALRLFSEGEATADQAVCIVQAVLAAAQAKGGEHG